MAAESGGSAAAPRVKCPGCGMLCRFAPDNKWRPFCSERCRNLDLSAWASESYRVSSQTDAPPDTDATA